MLNLKVKNSKMPVRERIILTMIKLKQNVSYVVLPLFFDLVNANTIRNIMYDVIAALAVALKPCVQWISADTVKKIYRCVFLVFQMCSIRLYGSYR